MKRLAIFDMDGTLQDSSGVIAGAINHVRERLGLPPMEEDRIVRHINDPHLDAARFFYHEPRFRPEHERWFSSYYSENHARMIRLYGGIEGLLHTLRRHGCLLAVATNAYRRSTLESLRHLGIADLFDAICAYDDVGAGKPSPDMLVCILERLGVAKEEAVFVGDGERDRLAAAAAGIDFVAVDWGYSDHDDAVGSIDELKDRLHRLGCGMAQEGL